MGSKRQRAGKVRAQLALVLACLWLASCASVPFDYPREPTQSVPASAETPLGEFYRNWQSDHGDKGGFVGMPSGVDALGMRLRMLELAEETIDAQYFILKTDRAGGLFVAGVIAAADRGVRVRLLVDDIFSPGVDEAFTLIASHPNIEVRLFNPLPRQAIRYLGYVTDFKRANRRMHNKSFTVDGAFSVVGGRNIGEEYFELNQDTKFDDFEVLMIGSPVEEVQQGFDLFWNSDLSVPMEAFGVKTDPAELDRWRVKIRELVEEQQDGLYAQALNSRLLQALKTKERVPMIAEAHVYTDTPEKLAAEIGDADTAVLISEVSRRFRNAQSELLIVTPYFIPQHYGVDLMEELISRGVRVAVLTNSLASTNHVPVHAGYSRYRKELLEMGVEFYEMRADAVHEDNDWGHRPEKMTLHSKATVVDRESIFVGSLNFDPRSVLINTEMGVFIESAEAGAAFTKNIKSELSRSTWRVDLDEKGQLRWTYDYDGYREVVYKEPQSSWWQRFQVGVYRLLPIENQL
ncbi:phospholipase D family protein [Halioglobus maricola]|nr:phospholipase D family protein [Halioglobus maricola]